MPNFAESMEAGQINGEQAKHNKILFIKQSRSYGASIFFSWTAITTIGYGHIVVSLAAQLLVN